jgi:hypothetical protein
MQRMQPPPGQWQPQGQWQQQQPMQPQQGQWQQPQQPDPLRLPLQLLIAGWATLIVLGIVGLTSLWILRATGYGSALFTLTSWLRTLLQVAGLSLLIAGSAIIAQKKRPGHELAVVAAIAYGGSLLMAAFWLIAGRGGYGMFGAIGFVNSLIDIAAAGSLVLSVRALGRSRARPLDAVVIGVLIILGINLITAVTGLAHVYLPPAGHYLSTFLNLGARVALIVAVWRIVSHVPLADPVFAQGSAYRGPMDALAMQQGGIAGSTALGFLAGFFGGCIGLGLVLAIAKGPATKRGAGIGFACQAVVGVALRAAAH